MRSSKPVGAFSNGVFDRGKRGLSVSEEPENGQVTRVSADVTSTGETAIRLWRVVSESLYDERMTKAGAEATLTGEAVTRRWGVLEQRCDNGADESQVVVEQRVPGGWDDGQEHL